MLVGYPTRSEWINSYDSKSTRSALTCSLKKFDELLSDLKINEEKFFQQARSISENELFLVIDKLKNNLEKNYASKTSRCYHGFILIWWRVNGIKIDQVNLKSRIRWNRPHTEIKYTPDRKTIATIIDNSSFIYKVFYLVAVSTGARQSEILSLTWRDIDLTKEVPSVHFLAENTKTKSERYSFLTPESRDMILKLQLSLNLEHSKNDKIFPISTQSLQKHSQRMRVKLGIMDKYGTGVSKLTIHRIRAYTKRRLSRACGDDFAHIILGHVAGGLGTYDGDVVNQLRADYIKAIPELTINLHAKDVAQREDQSEQIKLLKQKIELMEKFIHHKENDASEDKITTGVETKVS